MNCDEAFEALTDPTEPNHSALKWHLEFCPRCREMQQVLAPALAMFATDGQSADAVKSQTDQSRDLPRRREPRFSPAELGNAPARPFLTPEAIRVAEQSAQALHPVKRRMAFRWILAGVASALAAVAVFFVVHISEPRTGSSEPAMLADRCLWMERDAADTPLPTEDASSRWVVLSCVACHLEGSLD